MNTTISIPKATKVRVQKIAKKYDMTVSAIAKMLLNDFASGRIKIATFISPIDTLNNQTEKTLIETDQGKDLNKVQNSTELFNELGI